MKNTVIALLSILLIGEVLLAKKESKAEIDPVDAIIEKSQQTMKQAAEVSQMADKAVITQFEEMKSTIEVLEETNETLVEEKQTLTVMVQQVKKAYNEMVVKYDSVPVQQFDILAILPDSTNRG